MPCFLVTASVIESKMMPCIRVRLEGNSKLMGTAQPFRKLRAPMFTNKQTRPVTWNVGLTISTLSGS